jgi:OmpA-OmpF porin, OOP family
MVAKFLVSVFSLGNVVTFVLLQISFFVIAQNLVPNSGFEDYTRCPEEHLTLGQKLPITHWYSPNQGTPDYFNECSRSNSRASKNWAGRSVNFSGQGYAGLITFMNSLPYREYLAVQLLRDLDSGVTYHLQFSFRLSTYTKVASGHLGLALTSAQIKENPILMAKYDSSLMYRKEDWQIVSGDYKARGSERYLLIGNFYSGFDTPFYEIKHNGNNQPMLLHASYYYIDDVIVQPQIQFIPDLPATPITEDIFESDSTITLRNVLFTYNSSSINSISQNELMKLFNYLNANSTVRLEISGHTDDQGTDTYNNSLSKSRAEAVRNFLIEKGIREDRLISIGYGKNRPLVHEKDEMARSLNRRVEVRILKLSEY